jgi:hypothetical protein
VWQEEAIAFPMLRELRVWCLSLSVCSPELEANG